MPDSAHIIVTAGTSTERELYVISLRGKKKQITSGVGSNTKAAISDDGQLMCWIYQDAYATSILKVGKSDGRVARDLVVLDKPTAGVVTGHTKSIRWRSKDGLRIDGYLTLPVDYHSSSSYPLIVILHGGPLGGVDPALPEWPGGPLFTALLAARGYAILQPDYRNSGMFGWDKIIAARTNGIYAGGDFGDIMSGVDAVIRMGVANPSRLGILGHSNGSLETNWVITHTNRFKAAVSYEGYDMFVDWANEAGADRATEWYLRGTPFTSLEAYQKNSAALHANLAKTPTLFITKSTTTGLPPPQGMGWMYSALRENHVDTQYVLYNGT
jgi:dipeptidyl aminopeptidase/acylaminoacyl peptidase